MHASIELSARTHPSSFTLDNEQIEELERMSNEGRLLKKATNSVYRLLEEITRVVTMI
jgi:hypothetical protein